MIVVHPVKKHTCTKNVVRYFVFGPSEYSRLLFSKIVSSVTLYSGIRPENILTQSKPVLPAERTNLNVFINHAFDQISNLDNEAAFMSNS